MSTAAESGFAVQFSGLKQMFKLLTFKKIRDMIAANVEKGYIDQ